jgi:hypothetical protein
MSWAWGYTSVAPSVASAIPPELSESSAWASTPVAWAGPPELWVEQADATNMNSDGKQRKRAVMTTLALKQERSPAILNRQGATRLCVFLEKSA